MVVSIDIKNTNLSRVSVFSGGSTAGGGAKRSTGSGGGILEDMDNYLSLSYKQRLIGFLCCLVAGAVIGGLAFLSIHSANIRMFVILFSLGNIVMICSTMFLMGPINQIKRMFLPVRIIATIVFLTAVGLTIYFGYKRKLLLAILCAVIELFALIWYSLSYIPYARTLICKLIGLG